MIGLTEIRAIAMVLPQVEEGPPVRAAHRIAGFKVAGKSFVGVEVGGKSMTVSLPEKEAKRLRQRIQRHLRRFGAMGRPSWASA